MPRPRLTPSRRSELPPGGLAGRVRALLAERQGEPTRFRHLFDGLTGRGHAALLVVLSLPFCLPLPLFGLSTPFGLVLAFVGLRVAFGRRPWLPGWLLDKPVRTELLVRVADKCAVLERRLLRLLRPRWTHLCHHPWWQVSHGLTIAVLAVLLALPVPVPFSNIATALPILLIGLGLLEDDGIFIILGYVCAWTAIIVGAALVFAGGIGIDRLIKAW